jgi:hypothetical protein
MSIIRDIHWTIIYSSMHTHGSTAIRMEARGLNCTGHHYYYCRRCRRLVEPERRKFMRSGTREQRDPQCPGSA